MGLCIKSYVQMCVIVWVFSPCPPHRVHVHNSIICPWRSLEKGFPTQGACGLVAWCKPFILKEKNKKNFYTLYWKHKLTYLDRVRYSKCVFVRDKEGYDTYQASRVELLLTGTTGFLRKGIVGSMDDREADHAVFHSLKTLIHIVLPQRQSFHDAAVLHRACQVYASVTYNLWI